MAENGGIVVYVTSHGFGHLNRTVGVINRFPTDVPVTIKSHPNLFTHWKERLQRPATLAAHVSDVGAINPPGDSAATDGAATLKRAAEVHAQAIQLVDAEADWLRDIRAAAVLADAPPLPLVAAQRAGVPGFLLANFTWAEIYASHAEAIGGDAPAFVAEIRRAYRHATAVFRAQPSLAMADFPSEKIIDVGIVAVAGKDRRAELRSSLKLTTDEKLVYLYMGRYGQADLGWQRLATLKSQGIHFVGFHPAPGEPLENLHVVAPTDWTGADLAASADAIVAKAGYGTVCEAMVAGTPMLYPPRRGFAEHRGSRPRPARLGRRHSGVFARRSPSSASTSSSLAPSNCARPSPLPGRRRSGSPRDSWRNVERSRQTAKGKNQEDHGTIEIQQLIVHLSAIGRNDKDRPQRTRCNTEEQLRNLESAVKISHNQNGFLPFSVLRGSADSFFPITLIFYVLTTSFGQQYRSVP